MYHINQLKQKTMSNETNKIKKLEVTYYTTVTPTLHLDATEDVISKVLVFISNLRTNLNPIADGND